VQIPNSQQRPLLHSVKAGCKLLGGISTPTLYREAAAGRIKLVHVGCRTFLPDAEVRRLADEGTSPFEPLQSRQTGTKRGNVAKLSGPKSEAV
jgi:hypothetical protein